MSDSDLSVGTAPAEGLPVSGLLAVWLGAQLAGRCSTDDLLDALGTSAVAHVVDGQDVLSLLAALRRAGAHGTGLALPVPGDLAGLRGPADFNAAAVEAEEAVIVRTATGAVGLVPSAVGAALEWTSYAALPTPPGDPVEAGQRLRTTLLEATRALVELDVAAWRPEVADLLTERRHAGGVVLPRDFPPRLAETIDRALLCREVVALALADDGAAVSSYEAGRRRDALLPLERAARHALVAACSTGGG